MNDKVNEVLAYLVAGNVDTLNFIQELESKMKEYPKDTTYTADRVVALLGCIRRLVYYNIKQAEVMAVFNGTYEDVAEFFK
ncbi:MAG: hypothetical protein ACRC9P_00955 [Bacteroides sp.]